MTVEWLKELRNRSKICHLCGIRMKRHGKYPGGKNLDHIIPLSIGGPHTKENLRYICAECNCNRPSDGSDIAMLSG